MLVIKSEAAAAAAAVAMWLIQSLQSPSLIALRLRSAGRVLGGVEQPFPRFGQALNFTAEAVAGGRADLGRARVARRSRV